MLFIVVIKFYDTELLFKREMMTNFMHMDTFEYFLVQMTTYYSFINFGIFTLSKIKELQKKNLIFGRSTIY